MTDKQKVLETISGLPEQASLQQIAEEAADAGRTTPHEEVKKLLFSWTAK
jgi:predicted transcriptional regulator